MFNYNSKFMTALLSLTDAVVLGVLWLMCSVPVVTMGAASAAFYYAYNKSVCQKNGYAWQAFFGAFKSNFKQATKIWLIILLAGFIIDLVNLLLIFLRLNETASMTIRLSYHGMMFLLV